MKRQFTEAERRAIEWALRYIEKKYSLLFLPIERHEEIYTHSVVKTIKEIRAQIAPKRTCNGCWHKHHRTPGSYNCHAATIVCKHWRAK